MSTIDQQTPELDEINSLYAQMGLASASDRARFTAFGQPERPALLFQVVTTTTSQPFAG